LAFRYNYLDNMADQFKHLMSLGLYLLVSIIIAKSQLPCLSDFPGMGRQQPMFRYP